MQVHDGISLQIRQKALELGFSTAGITSAEVPEGYPRLLSWIDAGYHADMQWMERRKTAYEHPDSVMSGTQSVIMVGMNYHEGSHHADGARVSRYAWGTADYHDDLRQRLSRLAEFVRESIPGARTRCIVDTAPLLERDFARRAGIGWFGKNTMLISREIGSWFFLGAVLTDAALPSDSPFVTDHCGTCTRCLDICPTGAFPEPDVLDAGKCISYLTIEQRKDPIPETLRKGIGPWIFGCDLCQDVCPWNRFAPQSAEEQFAPRDFLNPPDCGQILRMTEDEFQSFFQGTALLRAGRAGLARNAAVVAGNLRLFELEPDLQTALEDNSPLVRGAAIWALGQFETESAMNAIRMRLPVETDEQVLSEIHLVLKNVVGDNPSRLIRTDAPENGESGDGIAGNPLNKE